MFFKFKFNKWLYTQIFHLYVVSEWQFKLPKNIHHSLKSKHFCHFSILNSYSYLNKHYLGPLSYLHSPFAHLYNSSTQGENVKCGKLPWTIHRMSFTLWFKRSYSYYSYYEWKNNTTMKHVDTKVTMLAISRRIFYYEPKVETSLH